MFRVSVRLQAGNKKKKTTGGGGDGKAQRRPVVAARATPRARGAEAR
jgi:hypothetical protein